MQVEIVDLEDLPRAPSRRYGHSSTRVGDKLYVFGGTETPTSQSTTQALQFHSSLHVFDIATAEWAEESYEDDISGVGRHFHTCVLNDSDGCLYVFGGKSNGYRNDILRFDPAENSFELVVPTNDDDDEIPSPRWGHSAVFCSSPVAPRMLVFGGYDSNGFVHNTVHEFSFPEKRWRRLSDISGLREVPRRYLHSGIFLPSQDSYVIVRGLQKNGQALDDVWCLSGLTSSSATMEMRPVRVCYKKNTTTSLFSKKKVVEKRTYGQRVFVLDGKLYLYGGRSTGDDVKQCLRLDLVFGEDEEEIRGELCRVEFPFVVPPSAYGSVNAIQVESLINDSEEESEGEEDEEEGVKLFKLFLFGGQGTTLKDEEDEEGRNGRRIEEEIVPTMVDLPQVFSGAAANLIHFLPDDVLFIHILEHLDRVSLCSLRAVSSRWSPSLLSSADRLWKPIYKRQNSRSRYRCVPGRQKSLDDAVTFKAKCQVVMRVYIEEKTKWDARDRLLAGAENIKTVLVGDGAIGKTCLLISLANGKFPDDYVPTVFDNYNHLMPWDTKHVSLGLYDRLRPLSYPETNVFLMCFSLVDRTSFLNISTKWYPELQEHAYGVPIILCGTKLDLREDSRILAELQEIYSDGSMSPVTHQEGTELAERLEYVQGYVENSAKTLEGVAATFEALVTEVIGPPGGFPEERSKKCGIM